jgi:lipoprotein-releasing system permease protein
MFIAGRYLKSRRRESFISLISMISITGVALGVIALDCSLSMMNGFETEIRQRIVETPRISRLLFMPAKVCRLAFIGYKVQEVPELLGVAPSYAKSVIGSV